MLFTLAVVLSLSKHERLNYPPFDRLRVNGSSPFGSVIVGEANIFVRGKGDTGLSGFGDSRKIC